MPAEVIGVQCKNKECKVAETGKCIEGLALNQCPHIIRSDTLMEQPIPTVANGTLGSAQSTEPIQLPTGQILSVSQASEVLRAGETRVLAIIGPVYSGKTSLIASLYEIFQKPLHGNFQFARSRTLSAFEQACHDARASSQRPEPETARTPRSSLPSGVGFYHLGLRNGHSPGILDLVLADRTGEEYLAAADNPSLSSKFIEVKHADSLSLVVDGELLLDLTARHNVRSETEMVLQGLVDADATWTYQRVAIVLTKLDVIKQAPTAERKRTEGDFKALVQHVRRVFGSLFSEIRPFKVAASPKNDVLAYGYGVSTLLQFWMLPLGTVTQIDAPVPKPTRAMGRFTVVEQENLNDR